MGPTDVSVVDELVRQLHKLTPKDRAEVADFVAFLLSRRSITVRTETRLSENAFSKVWDNEDDAAYDAL